MDSKISSIDENIKSALAKSGSPVMKSTIPVNLISYGLSSEQEKSAARGLKKLGVVAHNRLYATYAMNLPDNEGILPVEGEPGWTRYFIDQFGGNTFIWVEDNRVTNNSLPIVIASQRYKHGKHFNALFNILGKYMDYPLDENSKVYGIVKNYGTENLLGYDRGYRGAILKFTFENPDLESPGYFVTPLKIGERIPWL